jgi:hypothetical protein
MDIFKIQNVNLFQSVGALGSLKRKQNSKIAPQSADKSVYPTERPPPFQKGKPR